MSLLAVSSSSPPSLWFCFNEFNDKKTIYRLAKNNLVQMNSIIVNFIIVENSKIVDNLTATKDSHLIKIHNSRNFKIVELFWRGCEKYGLFPIIFAFIFSRNVLHSYLNVPPYMCSHKMIVLIFVMLFSIFFIYSRPES